MPFWCSPSFADVSFDRAQQLVFGERLRQIMLRAHDAAAGSIEQSVLARKHDHRDLPEYLVMLDQRASLVAIQARHHDVHEHDIGLMVGDLGQCVEAIDGGEHFAALLGQKGFGGPSDRLAVVDHEDFESREFRLAVGDHALHEYDLEGLKATRSVGAGIVWRFYISRSCQPRYAVDISR